MKVNVKFALDLSTEIPPGGLPARLDQIMYRINRALEPFVGLELDDARITVSSPDGEYWFELL